MVIYRRDEATRGWRRAWVSGLAASVAVAALGLMPAAPATAHNVLVGTTPEDGSTVSADLTEVELVFDDAVQAQFSQVAVLDAAENTYHTGDPQVTENVVTQGVVELPEGNYTVSYRVVSADGHPVSGTFEFAVAADAASGSGAGAPAASPSDSAASPDDTSAVGEESPADDDQPSTGIEPTATTATTTAPAGVDSTPAASTGTEDGITGVAAGGLIVALLAGLGLLTLRNRQRLRRSSSLGREDPNRGDSSAP